MPILAAQTLARLSIALHCFAVLAYAAVMDGSVSGGIPRMPPAERRYREQLFQSSENDRLRAAMSDVLTHDEELMLIRDLFPAWSIVYVDGEWDARPRERMREDEALKGKSALDIVARLIAAERRAGRM